MNNLTRDEIAEYIYQEFGLSKKDCLDMVNFLVEEIILGLVTSNSVKIHNFGTFKLKTKKPRLGRNPLTKEEVMISKRNVISFIPSKKTLKILNITNDDK